MIIQLAPDAPLIVRAVADLALVTHIGGASLGLASGTVSVLARKGAWLHRKAGTVFFAAMLAMGGAGAVTAPFLPDPVSTVMGIFVVYLVSTSWAVVRRPPGRVGRFEVAACAGIFALAAVNLGIGIVGGTMPGGMIEGEPSQIGYVAAALAGLAGAADLSMIRRGGLMGRERVVRHLWRMTLALAIAWGSFAGQPRAQPEFLKHSPLLIAPALVTLGLLFFWLLHTRFAPWTPRRRTAAATPLPAE